MKTKTAKILCAIAASLLVTGMIVSLIICCVRSRPGEQGVPGSDGLTPYIGENGNWWIGESDTGVCAMGRDGRDGVNGKDGLDGRDGVDGAPGEKGDTGDKGNDGAPGRHVTSFVINDNGELVVHYSDDATQNLGKISSAGAEDTETIEKAEIESGVLVITLTDGSVFRVGNVNSTVATQPTIRINADTKNWEVSYDNGQSWEDLGCSAIGSSGNDAVTPTLRINADTKNWEVSYDNGQSWEDLGFKAVGNNGNDAVTPTLRINADTKNWEVSYDNGNTWEDLGFSAAVTNGEDGVTPQLRINADTKEWEVSYDKGESWLSLGYNASAQQGLSGVTPMLRLNYDTKQWQVSYDNGLTWADAGYSGRNEQEINERVIVNIEIIDGYLWVTYEDSDTPVNMGKVPS